MSENAKASFDDEVERLQALLSGLESLVDPRAKEMARDLLQVVIGLHQLGLADLLAIVEEAGTQPADTLIARFAANPRIHGLLLLHDLHPDDLPTRARKAVQRLRPHLGVSGINIELVGTEQDVIRVRVVAGPPQGKRPSASELNREIENMVMEMAPDAADLIIEGLESVQSPVEFHIPLTSITRVSSAKA